MVAPGYYFSNLLDFVLNLFYQIYNISQKIFGWFVQPIAVTIKDLWSDVLRSGNNDAQADILEKLIPDDFLVFLFSDYSFVEFMLGAGIGFFLIYSLIKWFIDIVF